MEKEEDVRRLGGGWKESEILVVMVMAMRNRKMGGGSGRKLLGKVW